MWGMLLLPLNCYITLGERVVQDWKLVAVTAPLSETRNGKAKTVVKDIPGDSTQRLLITTQYNSHKLNRIQVRVTSSCKAGAGECELTFDGKKKYEQEIRSDAADGALSVSLTGTSIGTESTDDDDAGEPAKYRVNVRVSKKFDRKSRPPRSAGGSIFGTDTLFRGEISADVPVRVTENYVERIEGAEAELRCTADRSISPVVLKETP